MKVILKHSCPGNGQGPCPAKAWVFTIKCDRCAFRGPFKVFPPIVEKIAKITLPKVRPIVEKPDRRRIEPQGHGIKTVGEEIQDILEQFRNRKRPLTRYDIL